MRSHASVRWLVFALIPIVLAGCPFSPSKDEEPPPPPPTYKEVTSPENVLFNFEMSYEEKNFNQYEPLFTNEYRFFFNPLDVLNNPDDIPPSWNARQDLDATRGLFEDPDVEGIRLEWVVGSHLEPGIDGAEVKIKVSNIQLEVDERQPDGELLTHLATGEAEFYFRKTGETTSRGDSLWGVVRWDDLTIPPQ